MNESPTIAAPDAAPILLKKIGSAIFAAIDSATFTAISFSVAALTYLIFLGFGNGAHGQWPDGAFIVFAWLCITLPWIMALDARKYRYRSICERFENERLHRAALWWSGVKGSRRGHLACWPLLLALFWSSTEMQYSAPGADGITSGCGEYLLRVNGVVLSKENSSARALPWHLEWVPVQTNLAASTRATSLDGIKFGATVTADLALGDDSRLWPWQNDGLSDKYPKAARALQKAAESAVAKMESRSINQGTFALAIDTALALDLREAGLRPNGKISVSLEPYFDGSETKLGAEKK